MFASVTGIFKDIRHREIGFHIAIIAQLAFFSADEEDGLPGAEVGFEGFVNEGLAISRNGPAEKDFGPPGGEIDLFDSALRQSWVVLADFR